MKDAAVFPGIFETSKPLKHETTGCVCGGVGDKNVVKVFQKNWKGGKFARTDSPSEYRMRKTSFIDTLAIGHGDATIYTCVMLFHSNAPDYSTSLRPLIAKKEKYTSFVDFLKYFEAESRPNLYLDAQAEMLTCLQRADEDVGTYYHRFEELVQIVGREPDDCVHQWVDGLKNGETALGVVKRLWG